MTDIAYDYPRVSNVCHLFCLNLKKIIPNSHFQVTKVYFWGGMAERAELANGQLNFVFSSAALAEKSQVKMKLLWGDKPPGRRNRRYHTASALARTLRIEN